MSNQIKVGKLYKAKTQIKCYKNSYTPDEVSVDFGVKKPDFDCEINSIVLILKVGETHFEWADFLNSHWVKMLANNKITYCYIHYNFLEEIEI